MENINLIWRGMLTIKNIGEVANTLRELLTGKKFTLVIAHENIYFRPEVTTCQILISPNGTDEPIKVWHWGERSSIDISSSNEVWSFETSIKENEFDPKFLNPYINFDSNKIFITWVSNSRKMYWVAAVEGVEENKIVLNNSTSL